MKMVAPAKKLMTADEFAEYAALPENENRWLELVRGEVVELPNPKKPHGSVCAKVALYLGMYRLEKGWGEVTSNDSGVVLSRDPDTVRGPDVAFFAEEDEEEGYAETPPLLAVEVLSPDDRANKVVRKIAEYLASGVKLVWIVDPSDRSVTVHQPKGTPKIIKDEDEITGEEALPEFRCKVSAFFSGAKKDAKRKGRNGKR